MELRIVRESKDLFLSIFASIPRQLTSRIDAVVAALGKILFCH